jgi:hypothetical protein
MRTTISVKYEDGRTELVQVGFSLQRIDQLNQASDAKDLRRIIEINCDRPPGWAATLTPESASRILQESVSQFQNFLQPYISYFEKLKKALTDAGCWPEDPHG